MFARRRRRHDDAGARGRVAAECVTIAVGRLTATDVGRRWSTAFYGTKVSLLAGPGDRDAACARRSA
jgi:hypothetical protein